MAAACRAWVSKGVRVAQRTLLASVSTRSCSRGIGAIIAIIRPNSLQTVVLMWAPIATRLIGTRVHQSKRAGYPCLPTRFVLRIYYSAPSSTCHPFAVFRR
jgi:hypothetical protein